METVTIAVKGMDCTGCVGKTRDAATQVNGVVKLEGNPTTEKVVVTYDPAKTNPDEIITAINKNTTYAATKI